jgi:hypothetical protein
MRDIWRGARPVGINIETSRSSFLLSHFGHLARCRPSTTLSNRLPHPRQTYSKIGIIVTSLTIQKSCTPYRVRSPRRRQIHRLPAFMKLVVSDMQSVVEMPKPLDEKVRHLGQILMHEDVIINAPGEFF